jgi:hypothetical protein
MTLLDLLPINEDQFDVVPGAVKCWCEKSRSSIDDENGRNAMAVGVKHAACVALAGKELTEVISRDMMCRWAI